MTDEQEFRKTVAEKITFYRKAAHLTQNELAEKLNYSDKSVSKWERGEGLPDVYVLCLMAELFGVSLNELTDNRAPELKGMRNTKKVIIPILSVCIVWLVASVVFFALKVIPIEIGKSWFPFICAIPVSFIVFTVFSCLWHGLTARAVCISGIVWGVFLVLRTAFSGGNINFFLIICGILQVMVILWFYLRRHIRKYRQ